MLLYRKGTVSSLSFAEPASHSHCIWFEKSRGHYIVFVRTVKDNVPGALRFFRIEPAGDYHVRRIYPDDMAVLGLTHKQIDFLRH